MTDDYSDYAEFEIFDEGGHSMTTLSGTTLSFTSTADLLEAMKKIGQFGCIGVRNSKSRHEIMFPSREVAEQAWTALGEKSNEKV